MKSLIAILVCAIFASCFVAATQFKESSLVSISNDTVPYLPLLNSSKAMGNKISSDALENIYVSSNTSIWKTSSQNSQNFVFDNKKSGNITHIDASDPMKILVFYKDLSLITFLDNFMAESSFNVSLSDFNLDQAEIVCRSINNGIWVYDLKQDKLVKINYELKVEVEILNIQRIIGEDFSPKQMLERSTGLYLNDPMKGIYVFDNYGSYLRKIPETNISKFTVIDNIIAFRKGNNISTLNTQTLELNTIYKDSLMTDFSISAKKLYILNDDSLHIYKLNP